MNLAPNRLSEDRASCYVCGKDCHEASFARIYEPKRKVYLCCPTCVLAYFDKPNPPPHDHQAPHEYDPVPSALIEATRAAGFPMDGVNFPLCDEQQQWRTPS